MNLRRYLTCLAFVVFFGLTSAVSAQEVQRDSATTANCGDIIEGEFTSNYQEITYTINLKAGDSLDVSLTPLGKQLRTSILITGPTNIGMGISNGIFDVNTGLFYRNVLEEQPKLSSGILPASGNYTARIINLPFYQYVFSRDEYGGPLGAGGGIGVYTLYIGCTFKNGKVINPGDNISDTTTTDDTYSTISSVPKFSGTGFPGLPSVDFADVSTNDLSSGQTVKAKIASIDSTVHGYTFDAAANDNLALSFTRISGNLNLGLVVLSADNKVVFQASLVTSSELTTKFTLPSAGTYTIGIFRIDLLPPDAPEATAFQLTATLNP